MATSALTANFVEIIAAEMSSGVERAVEYWLTQIDQILMNEQISSLGKLAAIHGLLESYKRLTGKGLLKFVCGD